jgi:xanthine dehydrogenase small subunit
MKSRSSLVFYINDRRLEVTGNTGFQTLSDFLRYEQQLTGTKVVCAEGDCGACTVLLASVHELDRGRWAFKAVNSCILPILAVDGCQIVTVEGLRRKNQDPLHPVQSAMLNHFGSQCGFCTPGFVCAMTALAEDSILTKKPITEKRTKNYLTGNLCRCTGYDPIIKASLALDLKEIQTLQDQYHDARKIKELQRMVKFPVEIQFDEFKVFLPTTLAEALKIKHKYPETRIVAGATDLGVAVNKGRSQYQSMMSLQNIPSLWNIQRKKNHLEIPCRVSLAHLQKHLQKDFPEFDRMLNIFASPQIKNSGTLVGNVVNASPISDTIPFLMVMDALVEVRSRTKKRLIPIDEFFLGYKTLNLKPSEIVTGIHLPLHKGTQISKLYKVSLRKDLDISAVTMAARLKVKNRKIEEIRFAFGGVGPVVLRLKDIESAWLGSDFEKSLFINLSKSVAKLVTPVSDVRGSKEFRWQLCRNLVLKMADELQTEGLL